MTVNGQPENDSQIQNEEHEHDALAKRTMLVDSAGNYITSTNTLPVSASFTGSLSVNLDKDGDSVTVWQPTASNLKTEVTGTVSVDSMPAISVGTVSIDNFPSTQAINGTVSVTILGGTTSIDNFPSGFTNTISGTVSVDNLLSTVSVDNLPSTQAISGEISATILSTVNATILGGTISNLLAGTVNATVLGGNLNATVTNTVNSTAYQGTTPWEVSDVVANSLVPSTYDYISLSYTGSNLREAVFRIGGSTGSIISTLTMSYDGSDNLVEVEKS